MKKDCADNEVLQTVFISGSRVVKALDEVAQKKLSNIQAKGFKVIIGDANGIDKSVQDFYRESGYDEVTVYVTDGVVRNNLGNWKVVDVSTTEKRGSKKYYHSRDDRLVEDCTIGFAIWNGKSNGTFRNIQKLSESDKPVVVYYTVTSAFYSLKTTDDFVRFAKMFDLLEEAYRRIRFEIRKD